MRKYTGILVLGHKVYSNGRKYPVTRKQIGALHDWLKIYGSVLPFGAVLTAPVRSGSIFSLVASFATLSLRGDST